MAIDYTIPAKFGQLGVKLPDPLQTAQTLAALKQQAYQFESLKATQEKQQTLASLAPQAVNFQTGELNPVAVQQMMAVDPSGSAVNALLKAREQAFPQFSQGTMSPTKIENYRDEASGKRGVLLVTPGGQDRFVPQEPVEKPVEAPKMRTIPGENGEELTQEFDSATGKFKTVAVKKPNAGGKAPTDSQQKYAFFASRGETALNDLDKLFKGGYRPSETVVKYLSMNPSDLTAQQLRKTLSPTDLLFAAAAPKALTSILRPESGAVISPDEIGAYLQAYIPMAGEGVSKLDGLRKELQNLRTMSKGGLPGDVSGTATPNAPAKPKQAGPKKDLSKVGVKF